MSEFIGAVKAGDQEKVIGMLALAPGLVDSKDTDGTTAVQAAVYNFRFEIAKLLVERGAELDLPSACCVGDTAKIAELAAPGQVDQLSVDGFTPLSLAAAFGGPAAVRALLDSGANVNLRGTALGGVAPVHACVFGRNNAVLDTLLKAGADPNLTQEGGFTALMGAAQNGDSAAVNLLLAAGADRNAQTADGQTAADLAHAAGHEGII